MHKALLLIILFSAFVTAGADTLKIGKSSSGSHSQLKNLHIIGEMISSELEDIYEDFSVTAVTYKNLNDLTKQIKQSNFDIYIDTLHNVVQISENTDMEPALLVSRLGSVYMNSFIIVRKDSGIHTLGDLKGKVVAIEQKYDTSSFHLPKKAFADLGLGFVEVETPDADVPSESVGFYVTKNKNKVVNSAYIKKTHASAICSKLWEAKNAVPDFMKENLKIIHETESIPGMYLMMNKNMPQKRRERLINLLLKLETDITYRSKSSGCVVDNFHKIGFDIKSLLNNTK